MKDTDIQKAVNALLADMVARGLVKPVASAQIEAHRTPSIYLHWDEDGCQYGRTELGRGDTVFEAVENAKEILGAIPPKADRDKAEFARLLANAIDKGRAIGIEVDFLNPLTEMMKCLSENALTYRPAPEPEMPF